MTVLGAAWVTVKLNPKKGDSSQINNWRPISLLNCIYKIFSKAVNNRLKKVIDIITCRAQKGFTQSRYIQEVLINVIHSIRHCNKGNIPAFVLSLDQRKAFDSVRHDFMLEVYKFWGLGESFSSMLNLITTFALETGAPQGNSPSPLQYNFCEQIAILKLELDPRIASIYNHHLIPRNAPALAGNFRPDHVQEPDPVPVLAPVLVPVPMLLPAVNFEFLPGVANIARNALRFPARENDPFSLESNRETDKVESFADDKTVIFLATETGLSAIREILNCFTNFSGLACNMDKSVIMYIGADTPLPLFWAILNLKWWTKLKF